MQNLFVKKINRLEIVQIASFYILLNSNTLIDNIFSNVTDPGIISGNLTATISDHLPQFTIICNVFGNIWSNKSNIYERE